ncbi:MAG: hypothetical protein COB67_11565 [SAR324 cluster bacterium]|uniref:histidine kinase n=1 Tax=SAR324 cluster bacterium TaxID=2024889 RepID=A0A2A4STV2_9DELT|nr:MAG: hypothetical protein COB67_11565 [SAR324 cluster bacterium]
MNESIRILAVDDDLDNLELMGATFEDEGIEVWTASSALSTLEILNSGKTEFHAIFLDWMMPGYSGIELLNTLKRDQHFRNIPVVMQTARVQAEDIALGMRLGAFQYLTKPFSRDTLISVMNSAIAEYGRLHQKYRGSCQEPSHIEDFSQQLINVTKIQDDFLQNFDSQKLLAKNHRLKKTLKQLSLVDVMRNEQLTKVSHELKSPLASILGYADTLSECPLEEDERQQILQIIIEEVERLGRLIGNQLDQASFEHGKLQLNLNEIDLDQVIQKSVQAVQGLIQRKKRIGIQYIPKTIKLIGDRDRLEQVLINLLGNAIKFSPDRSTILITAEQRGYHCQVQIKDQGPGIPEQELDEIFEKFHQADSPVASQGTGLGLTISREIIHAHQGSIWAESSSQGAAFNFSLPLGFTTRQT